MGDINKERDEDDSNILLAQFICDDAIIEEDDIDEEEEKISELIYYNSVKLGNICYLSDQFEINSDDGLLHYIGTATKPTQPIGLKNYSYMFAARCHLETIDLSEWNMSEAEDTSYMFSYCKSLIDISSLENWDVYNIRNMSYMFEYCCFLEDIKALLNWDVCNVKSMRFMFSNCHILNDISPLWKWFDKDLNKLYIYNLFKTTLVNLLELKRLLSITLV